MQEKSPTISLCMIARNEEQLIKNALDSVKPFVDEIIVVDTGSKDATKEIAKECGAIVYDFTWENNFSKAKNFAKSLAKGQWILLLDADECISFSDLNTLKEMLATLKEQEKPGQEIVAFAFISRHYTTERGSYAHWKELTATEKNILIQEFPLFIEFNGYHDTLFITRLFKNRPQIYFKGQVHEDVNPSIIKWSIQNPLKTIVQVSLPIHHLHFLKNKEYIAEKQKLYFELSKEKVKQGKDPKTCLDLAVGYLLFEKDFENSFLCIADAIFLQEHIEPEEKAVIEKKAAIKLLIEKRKQFQALRELMQLLDFKQHDMNSVFNLAKAFYQRRAYRAAILVLRKLLEASPQEVSYIEYLGVCYDKINSIEAAINIFERGMITHPQHPPFSFNLGALYEKQKNWKKAIASFEHTLQCDHPLKEQLKARIIMLKSILNNLPKNLP